MPEENDLLLGTGRRLQMAVMFIDLCGFSARPAVTSAEQELLLRTFDFFFTEMIRVAEDYGGTVEKNTGDGLMAYFEDRGGVDLGTRRAVGAALTMLDTTDQVINPVLRNNGIKPIDFRVGIDYGTVTVARIGAAKRFGSLVAIGATANIACKMLSVGKAGEILLGANAHHQLPADWQKWSYIHSLYSGWVYQTTNLPYPFYRYTGRWTQPLW